MLDKDKRAVLDFLRKFSGTEEIKLSQALSKLKITREKLEEILFSLEEGYLEDKGYLTIRLIKNTTITYSYQTDKNHTAKHIPNIRRNNRVLSLLWREVVFSLYSQ